MKLDRSRKLTLVIALAILGGVVIGNIPFARTTIAAVVPPQFLEVVTHNLTLSGDGTVSVPLSIANSGVGTNQLADGSVTSAKIATSQVVKSFNGLSDNIFLQAGPNVTLTTSGNILTIESALGLTSVSRDTTLTGSGTSASPLGVANNSVGTDKLTDGSVTSAKISSGQVVKTLNGLADNVTLTAGSNISITPSGNSLTISATSSQSPTLNHLQIATLRWYEVNQNGTQFSVGTTPLAMAFDGDHMWVANFNSASVTKLRASDGANLGNYPAGSYPFGIAFDGASIWVSNSNTISGTVTKLRASDGVILGTFPVGSYPNGIAFDGANIWVSNESPNESPGTVTKLRASDGANLGTFSAGNNPQAIAFDGANIWVTNHYNHSVTKLRASDGVILGTFPVGSFPTDIAFDGLNVWTSSQASGTVTKLRASDGANLGTFNVGDSPQQIVFDGLNVWISNFNGQSVTKLRASDGTNLGTFNLGLLPHAIAFDGANIWVTILGFDKAIKL